MFVDLLILLVALSVATPAPASSSAEGLADFALQDYPPICDSRVYCSGDVLHDIQLAGLFKDSKSFVDLKLKVPEEELLVEFDALKERSNGTLSKDQISQFVQDHFEQGRELESWAPPDFTENPSILKKIRDPQYRVWAQELNMIWRTLARKVKEDVREHPDLYSQIYLPNGLVVPGGRFKEIYYWDTYWIVYGLLVCDMHDTARGMIENLLSLVARFGYVPNGSRKYYFMRSQPPLLIPMADAFLRFNQTQGMKLISDYFEIFEEEFLFWLRHKMVEIEQNGQKYYLAHFTTRSKGPRPESYKEDYELAEHFPEQWQRDVFYNQIKTAAETGWDFSSRHINKDGTNEGNLTNTLTESIVQVDLNALLEQNARILSRWCAILGKPNKSAHYKEHADDLLKAITAILWNEEEGIWFDYDLLNKKQRKYFYASNFAPLWTKSYRRNRVEVGDLAVQYLSRNGLIDPFWVPQFWGMPMSLLNTTQQWDYPNMWAPLQSFFIFGLDQTGSAMAQRVAQRFAAKYAQTNFVGYKKTGKMFEKYSAIHEGESGNGGEYEVQEGFGWSNGVIFQILEKYGQVLMSPNNEIDGS
nr:PREDICTED: trehalase-like [Bemisia tabaci]